jgi:hypothetical protein
VALRATVRSTAPTAPAARAVRPTAPRAATRAAPQAATARPERASEVLGVTVERPEGSDVWAVVVGIDEYPGTEHDLLGAGADASAAVGWLDAVGVPAAQRQVLRDGEATSPAIEDALDWLVDSAPAGSTAVVVYAGHAVNAGGHQSIVAADGRAISDQRLAERVQGLRSAQAWFVMASCYGGGFTEWLDRPGRALTAAAPANEQAFETDAYGRSYLTEFLFGRVLAEAGAPDHAAQAVEAASTMIAAENPNRTPVQAGDAALLLP